VDATLWYFEAIRAYHVATRDDGLLKELFPVLEEIVRFHREGTRYGIRQDPADGLLMSGEPGVQLTWMDAKVGDWVVTPRTGKAVEINALWYNALRSMGGFARRLGRSARPWETLAERVSAGFDRFWSERAGYCYDVIDSPDGNDDALRPNQIFAVSLPESPLSPERQRKIVDACARHLLTSYGLRSLVPGHPRYQGHYGGDQWARDGAYHQGTVWAWLLGPFALAHFKVYRDAEAARSFLAPKPSARGGRSTRRRARAARLPDLTVIEPRPRLRVSQRLEETHHEPGAPRAPCGFDPVPLGAACGPAALDRPVHRLLRRRDAARRQPGAPVRPSPRRLSPVRP